MANGGTFAELGAVGNVAQVSKQTTSQPQDLTSFSVKKGADGGILVCENYDRKTPAGRRAGSYPGGSNYKENPFSPDEGAAATSHITDLLSQMGIEAAAPEMPEMPESAPPPSPPSVTAMRGPDAGAVSVRGMAPGGGLRKAPEDPGY